MSRILILLAVLAAAASEPLVFSPYFPTPFARYATPFASAALVAPAAPAIPAAVAATVPATVPAAVPFSSVSAYSYGSSYSIQDYASLVNTAAPVYSSAYSLPYNYADWFYRR